MITLELTEEQAQALAGLIDAGVRATGIRGVKDAAELIEILDQAVQQSQNKEKE